METVKIESEVKMKIVKVRHQKDSYAKEYLFETLRNLKKGDSVICDTRKCGEEISICTSDSIEVKKEVLEFLETDGRWTLPLKKVVGKFNLDEWSKEK